MDAKAFGTFLAEARKAKGLTQSALAEQLHVTDKAVSRWERGLGFPDINTLEPLADALGLTLSQLMHADRGDGSDAGQSLEDFFSLLAPSHIQWFSVFNAMFWLTVGLAILIQLTCPMMVVAQWHPKSSGVLDPSLVLPKPVVCLICIGVSGLVTQICKAAERGFFRHSFFIWCRAFHPRIFPWVELMFHLVYIWFALCPLFAEMMILLCN